MSVHRFPVPVIVKAWCDQCDAVTDQRILPEETAFCRCSCGYINPVSDEESAA